MKKIIPICIVGILLCTAFGAIAQQSDENNIKEESQGKNLLTHTVFAEYGTATWCGYCKYAHGALMNIFKNEWFPFYYVSMVDDKNTHAAARIDQYNIYGFPTVFFDGGYKVNVGAGSIPGAQTTYNTSINQCGLRTVPNIDVVLSVNWLGNAAMNISVSVVNHDVGPYVGYIRVYVTEFGSTMGWIDTAGHPYTFPFLDYAFNQVINIAGSGTWSSSIIWDGHNYNDGFGHNFGNIQYGNIYVLAAAFNSEWHQGYAYPPSGYPFDSYWVDEAAGVRVGSNTPPNTPSNPNPTNGSTNVLLNKQLSWTGGDVNPFDTVMYDVYFGTTSPPPKVAGNQSGTTYNPGTLSLFTPYYWKIVAWDNKGASTAGPAWQFTTRSNQPPNVPSSPNPSNGSGSVPINAQLSWTGGDPNSDPVKYDVYFGTTSPPPKVTSNQSSTSYNPGTMIPLTTYYWKIIAWDSFAESTAGPAWIFTTSTAPNNSPNAPDISGPSQGKAGVNYTYNFTATDPDEDQISYYVDWGDSTSTGWLGPYTSGYQLTVNHKWSSKGTYIVKAKAKDAHDAESDWATLDVKMPTSFGITNPFLHWLFEQFPNAFPLLRHLFGV
ncbi:MAG: PKD domain-containing protein [Thermoplasmata archaeon]|nr:PKD domain-containing protein [Thermoplasmata archaeon]